MSAPYLELVQPLIPVAAKYTPEDDRFPCDIYLPALPPAGTAITIRDADQSYHTFIVDRVSIFLASPAKPICTIHLTELGS